MAGSAPVSATVLPRGNVLASSATPGDTTKIPSSICIDNVSRNNARRWEAPYLAPCRLDQGRHCVVEAFFSTRQRATHEPAAKCIGMVS